jgi:hypothetical protein
MNAMAPKQTTRLADNPNPLDVVELPTPVSGERARDQRRQGAGYRLTPEAADALLTCPSDYIFAET